MRKLTEFEDNVFTPKLYDIILPNSVLSQKTQNKYSPNSRKLSEEEFKFSTAERKKENVS